MLNQTYKNIEIIVVDDNGINTKFQLVNEKKLNLLIKKKKIIYIKHNINKNGAAARNTGINAATGDYITFLDDDDFFLKDRITLLVKKLEENKNFDCVYSSMIKLKNNHVYNFRKGNKEGCFLKEILSQYSFFGTGSNMFFTRNSINTIGTFDETFYRFQDLEYMARFFENGFKICSVKNVLVVKCEEDTMNVPNYIKMKNAKNMFCKKFLNSIKNFDFNEIMYSIYRELYIFSSNNDHKEAINILKKYGNIKLKDRIIYIYNKLTISNKFFNYLNFKIRKFRSINSYTRSEKEEINYIINFEKNCKGVSL